MLFKKKHFKKEIFLKQILYLSRKKNLKAKKIRGVLKKSYSKNSLPSIRVYKKVIQFFLLKYSFNLSI